MREKRLFFFFRYTCVLFLKEDTFAQFFRSSGINFPSKGFEMDFASNNFINLNARHSTLSKIMKQVDQRIIVTFIGFCGLVEIIKNTTPVQY